LIAGVTPATFRTGTCSPPRAATIARTKKHIVRTRVTEDMSGRQHKPTFVPPHEHVTTMPITWGPITFNPNRTFQDRTTPGKHESTMEVDTMSVRPEIFLSVMFGGLIVVILAAFLIFFRAHKRTARHARSMGIVVFASVDPHHGPPTCQTENPVSPVYTPPAYDDVTQSGPPLYDQINITDDNNHARATADRHKGSDLPPPYSDDSTLAQHLRYTEYYENPTTQASHNVCTSSNRDTFSSNVDHRNRNEQFKPTWQQPLTLTSSDSHDTTNNPVDDPPPYSMV
ncbi:hypothetical protein MAR_030317, partial [Mya arenaria]